MVFLLPCIVERIRYWNFLALPAYVLIERVLGLRLPEALRYGRGNAVDSLPNRLLRWWYTIVENRLWFPCGLSFVVVARRTPEAKRP